jgi:ketosteroid isomerase-like protein
MLIKSGAIIKCPEFYLNSRRPPNKKLDLSHKSAKAISRSPLKSKQQLKARAHQQHQQQQSQKKRNKRKKKKMNSKQDMVSDTESINSVCSSSSQLLSTSSSSTASWSAASSTTSSILSSFLTSSDGDTASSSSLFDDDHDEVEEDDDDKDIIPIHDQNSKLKVFEKIIALIAYLVGMNTQYQHSVHHHPDSSSDPNKKLAKAKNQKLNLNFFYKSILDDINIKNVRNILVSLIRASSCRYSHLSSQEPAVLEKKQQKNHLFTVKFIDMCCKSIKRLQSKNGLSIANSEQDRTMPFWHMLGNYSCGLLEIDRRRRRR